MANFKNRTTKPNRSDLEYVRIASGGWSKCVVGNPKDYECDTLANCVGYACGRFNEVYNEITGNVGMKYADLNCNAEAFPDRVKAVYPELQMGSTPKAGAIIVWRKGSSSTGSDGAGHVEFVEEVIDDHTIKTSASSYGGTTFYTATRTYNNGNWVNWANYYFRCFIYNPAVTDNIVEPVERDKYTPQVEVTISNLRIRSNPSTSASIYGICAKGIFNYTETAISDDLKWYKIGPEHWIADVDGVEELSYVVWDKPSTTERDTSVNQLQITIDNLRVRETPNTDAHVFGFADIGYYDVLDVQGKEDYTWYQIGLNSWVAGVSGTTYLPSTLPPDIESIVMENKKLKEENEELKKTLKEEQQRSNELSEADASLVEKVSLLEKDLDVEKEKLCQALEKANELVEILK